MGTRSCLSTRSVLVLVLVAAVLVAGCVESEEEPEPVDDEEQVTMTQHDGLSLAFRSYDEVYPEGDPVILELALENTGERRAENIEARLFGADFIAGKPPQFSGTSSLRGVDVDENRAGEDTTITWELENPVSLSAGNTETFPAGVRVRYNYETAAQASLTIVDEDQFDGNESQITPRVTAGPVSIAFDITSPQPVYSEEGQDTVEIPVPVRVTNDGDGEVADINGDPRPIQVVEASFPDSDSATLDCPPTVSLFDGTRRMMCTAHVPADVFERELRIQLRLTYDYFETQRTTFSVQGRK